MVITQSFNGAGDTWTPTWINVGCFWLWEIPLAYQLARRAGLGPRGVALAVTIAFSTVAVVSALLFRRGRWKLRRGSRAGAAPPRFGGAPPPPPWQRNGGGNTLGPPSDKSVFEAPPRPPAPPIRPTRRRVS